MHTSFQRVTTLLLRALLEGALLVAAAGCGARTGSLESDPTNPGFGDATPSSSGNGTAAGGGSSSGATGSSSGGGASGGSGGSRASSGGAGEGSVLCGFDEGLVSSCAAASIDDPVQVCDAIYPSCVRPPGFSNWACCTAGGPPYNGPNGSCRFPGVGVPSCGGFQGSAKLGGGSSQGGVVNVCLPAPLTLLNDGEPDCTVVVARLPAPALVTEQQIAACKACSEPGLSVPSPSLPLSSINTALAGYNCVCLVEPPLAPGCATLPDGAVSWCYSATPGGSPCPGAWLGFDGPPSFDATVYMTCAGP
jgi:hypothetical protein